PCLGPLAPRWAAMRSRGVRAETIASSDIAETPLSRISAARMAKSVQGNGDMRTDRLADMANRAKRSCGTRRRSGTFPALHDPIQPGHSGLRRGPGSAPCEDNI